MWEVIRIGRRTVIRHEGKEIGALTDFTPEAVERFLNQQVQLERGERTERTMPWPDPRQMRLSAWKEKVIR